MTPKKKAFKANYPKIFKAKEIIDWNKKKKTPFEILYWLVQDYVTDRLKWMSYDDKNPDYPSDDPVFTYLEKMPLVAITAALHYSHSDTIVLNIIKDIVCDPAKFLPLVDRLEKDSLRRGQSHGPAGRVLVGIINGDVRVKLKGL